MVKYILHYFKAQARAEAIRLAFKLAEVDYEELNFEMSEWPQLKSNYPTQQVPVLEVDGKLIGQSKAILRYLAREFGLFGKTSLEAAYIDQAVDTVEDIWSVVSDIFHGPAEERAGKLQKLCAEVVPPIYATLERLLALEKAGDFFVGNSITAADLFFFTAVDFVNVISPTKGTDSLKDFPKLTALKGRIAANPKIAAWLKVRPPEISL